MDQANKKLESEVSQADLLRKIIDFLFRTNKGNKTIAKKSEYYFIKIEKGIIK
jgi:hypothetical protein